MYSNHFWRPIQIVFLLSFFSLMNSSIHAQSKDSALPQRLIPWSTPHFEGVNYIGRVLTEEGHSVQTFKEQEQAFISQMASATGLSQGLIESLFGSLSRPQSFKPLSIHFIIGGEKTDRGVHELLRQLPSKLGRPTLTLPYQGHNPSFGTLANHLRKASQAEGSVIILSEFEKYGQGLSQFYAEWISSARQDPSIQNVSVIIYVDAKWLAGPAGDLSSESLILRNTDPIETTVADTRTIARIGSFGLVRFLRTTVLLPNPVKAQQDTLRKLLESADSIHILPDAVMNPYALSLQKLAENCGTSNDPNEY